MKPLVLAVVVVLFAAGCGGGGKSRTITIQLKERNGLGEHGVATLSPHGDSTKVTLQLEGGPANKDTPQPAHLHFNMCGGAIGDVYSYLKDVVRGKSTTDVPHSLADLQASPYAIQVHLSQDQIVTSVVCGDIPSTRGY